MRKIILLLIAAAIAIALYYNSQEVSNTSTEEANPPAEDEVYDLFKIYAGNSEVELVKESADRLYKYVLDNEIDSLATLFEYPIKRRYPTRDIADEKEFVARYKEIFDREFCDRILNAPYDWFMANWRGYGYGDYDFIIDCGASKIYKVNVYSQRAEELLSQAVEEELSLLHPDIKEHAIMPICSFVSKNGKWYGRIDSTSADHGVQLSLYKSTTPIDCAPDFMLLGVMSIEGAVNNVYYEFCGDNYDFMIENPTIWEANKYPYKLNIEHKVDQQQREESLDIEFVYWAELVK